MCKHVHVCGNEYVSYHCTFRVTLLLVRYSLELITYTGDTRCDKGRSVIFELDPVKILGQVLLLRLLDSIVISARYT